jgi:hypothetical protein
VNGATADELDAMRVRVPGHVVYRSFAEETVLLNLRHGTYHGLNSVAGDMFTALDQCDTVGEAMRRLTAMFDQSTETIASDLRGLIASLVERGLLEVTGDVRSG